MSSKVLVSLIVPIGPTEDRSGAVFEGLKLMPSGWQLVFVGCQPVKALMQQLGDEYPKALLLQSNVGRAAQMQLAVDHSVGQYLWFVHVDSVLTADHFGHVASFARQGHQALGCFELAFNRPQQYLNALGANLRTRWLGVPFGDQAFVLPARLFKQAGGFDQQARYGEDHLLVWQLKLLGVRVHCFRKCIQTSARRYQQVGTLKLTLIYQWRWLRQAMPFVLPALRKIISGG